VQITAAMQRHTGTNGHCTIDPVPIGDLIVEAQKLINGALRGRLGERA